MIVILISGTISPVFSYANAEESDIFPTWVRFMFEEWAKGQVSDMELKHALEFLLTNNILKLEKEKTQTALPKISTTTPALSNFYESQKSNISINDGNFFSVAQNAVTGWIKEIKNNPTANLLAISALPVIPVVEPLLANLYDNAEGSPEQKKTL